MYRKQPLLDAHYFKTTDVNTTCNMLTWRQILPIYVKTTVDLRWENKMKKTYFIHIRHLAFPVTH